MKGYICIECLCRHNVVLVSRWLDSRLLTLCKAHQTASTTSLPVRPAADGAENSDICSAASKLAHAARTIRAAVAAAYSQLDIAALYTQMTHVWMEDGGGSKGNAHIREQAEIVYIMMSR